MNELSRNRFFSSVCNTNHAAPSFGYGWNDNIVSTGANATGNWIPLYADTSGSLYIGGPQYTSVFSTLTGGATGQVVIPAGALAWNVLVQSGTAYVNGAPLFAGTNGQAVAGGGIGANNRLASAIVVGCSGGRALVSWDI